MSDVKSWNLFMYCLGSDTSENMAKWAMAGAKCLRPELKKKFNAERFINEAKKVYLDNEGSAQYQQKELKILNWVNNVIPALEVEDDKLNIDITGVTQE